MVHRFETPAERFDRKEGELRAEAKRYRRRLQEQGQVLSEFQEWKLRRMLKGVMRWGIFADTIGIENVLDKAGRVDVPELVMLVNAKLKQRPEFREIPGVISRDVTIDDFADEG